MFVKATLKLLEKLSLDFKCFKYTGESATACILYHIAYMYMYNHGGYSEMLVRSWLMKVTRLEQQSPQHRQKSYHRSVSHTCSITMHALLSIESIMHSHQLLLVSRL